MADEQHAPPQFTPDIPTLRWLGGEVLRAVEANKRVGSLLTSGTDRNRLLGANQAYAGLLEFMFEVIKQQEPGKWGKDGDGKAEDAAAEDAGDHQPGGSAQVSEQSPDLGGGVREAEGGDSGLQAE